MFCVFLSVNKAILNEIMSLNVLQADADKELDMAWGLSVDHLRLKLHKLNKKTETMCLYHIQRG